MCSFRSIAIGALVLILQTEHVIADGDGFVLGFGGEADTAGGRAVSVFGDYALSKKTWLSAMVANTKTSGTPKGFDTVYTDVGLDHWIDPLGIRIGGGYWGDSEVLDSNDLRASIYFRNDALSISANYERRNFDFVVNFDLLPEPRTVEFQGDGFGLATRFEIGDSKALSFGGMSYRYSRNINLQPYIDAFRFFRFTRLGLINNLIDYRYSAGIDWGVAEQSFDVRLERWQSAVNQETVDSISVGVLTPFGDRGDLEFRLAYDKAKNYDDTLAVSVFFYFFGA